MSTDHPPINPRKRPRQARAAATFDAILEAAARILESEGYDAVNTNAVADLAGVSVGSLYQYFPTREAILAELVRFYRNILIERVETAIAGSADQTLEETIDMLLEAALSHQFERPELALALEQVESMLPLDGESQDLTHTIVDSLETLFTRHDVENPHEAARDIVALVKGVVDAAGVAREVDLSGLHQRVRGAVLGYLSR